MQFALCGLRCAVCIVRLASCGARRRAGRWKLPVEFFLAQTYPFSTFSANLDTTEPPGRFQHAAAPPAAVSTAHVARRKKCAKNKSLC